MAFSENTVLRDTVGRFSEKRGAASEVKLAVRTCDDRNREQAVIDREIDAAADQFAAEHGVYVELGESHGFDYETGEVFDVTVTNPHGGSYTYRGNEPQNAGDAVRAVMHHAHLIRDDQFYRELVGAEKARETQDGARAILGRDYDRLATLSTLSAPPFDPESARIRSGGFSPYVTEERKGNIEQFLSQEPVTGHYETLDDEWTSAVFSRNVDGRQQRIRVDTDSRMEMSTESAMEVLIDEARSRRYGRFGFRGDKKREAEFKAFFGKDLKRLAR